MHAKLSQICCGIDEAGRGALAGPVTAAAVVLPSDFDTSILADSKALSPQKRMEIFTLLKASKAWIAVGWISAKEIDKINIHNATLQAMLIAYTGLIHTDPTHRVVSLPPPQCIDTVLIDGKFTPKIPAQCRAIIKGDATIPSIMAASIAAKIHRDLWMCNCAKQYPQYSFEKHKGYPTRTHKQALQQHGACRIHRLTFNGVVQRT